MKIQTKSDLGYKELSRIADFIRKIENGNEAFQNLLEDYSITIDYDLHADEVVLHCNNETTKLLGYTIDYDFFPSDLDIDY